LAGTTCAELAGTTTIACDDDIVSVEVTKAQIQSHIAINIPITMIMPQNTCTIQEHKQTLV